MDISSREEAIRRYEERMEEHDKDMIALGEHIALVRCVRALKGAEKLIMSMAPEYLVTSEDKIRDIMELITRYPELDDRHIAGIYLDKQ